MRLASTFTFITILISTVCSLPSLGQKPDLQAWLRVQDSTARSQKLNNRNELPRHFKHPSGDTGKRTATALANKTERSSGINCFDTSGSFFLKTDSLFYYAQQVVRTKEGKLLICGQAIDFAHFRPSGFIIKTDENGSVYWAKLFDSSGNTRLAAVNYYKILELKDGSLLLAGCTLNPITGNDDLIMTKTDNMGNIIWNKTYRSRLWGHGDGSSDFFYIQQIKQDTYTNDIFFVGPHWGSGQSISRINVNNGDIMWSRFYNLSYEAQFDNPFGIDLRANDLVVFARFLPYYSSPVISIYRINKDNGDTLQKKFFSIDNPDAFKLSILRPDALTRLNNGNYVVCGMPFGYTDFVGNTEPLYQSSIVEFDEDLNFVKAYCLKSSIQSNAYNNVTTVYPDGSGLFTMHESLRDNMYYIQFKEKKILKERKRDYSNGIIPLPFGGVQLKDGGDLNVQGITANPAPGEYVNRIEFLKLHISDTSSECLGEDVKNTFVQSFKMKRTDWELDSIGSDDFRESRFKAITPKDVRVQLVQSCAKKAGCATLKLTADNNTICVGETLQLTMKKDKECETLPFFDYNTSSVKSFLQKNDSLYEVRFASPWKGYIYATISSCNEFRDSIEIIVLSAPKNLDLGRDTIICVGDSLMLNATSGYLSYNWQDESSDSVFWVKKPGTYYVQTKNACGGIFSDTVVVRYHPPVIVDVGPDVYVCKGDTTSLKAPEGFISYRWSPQYKITSPDSITVKFFPLVDTTYILTAEKSAGCFGYDSLRVIVKPSPLVSLGKDTSFCENDSVTLDAGAGFDTYQWNTGATSETITVNKQGMYSVNVGLNNCFAADTIIVPEVYALPVFSLGNDTTLCEQQALHYNFPISSANFLWSTGSVTGTETITKPGTYTLTVTRAGCVLSDTVKVAYEQTPAVYLGKDTSICEGIMITLSADTTYASYLWQDGTTFPYQQVNKTGIYSVKASIGNCSSSDTIRISYKSAPYFDLGKDVFLCRGQQMQLTPYVDTRSSFRWQDGSTAPIYNIKGEGVYILTATNECGSFTDSVKVLYGICALQMPTAFTPNSDGLNDVFKVKYVFPNKRFRMVIYNRWGQKVYESTDITKGWDGNYRGMTSPADTYIWKIILTDSGGKEQEAHGTVTVIR